MMKTMTRNLMLLLMIAIMTLVPVTIASAASKKPSCAKKQTVYYSSSMPDDNMVMVEAPSCYLYIKNLATNAIITNARSSNPLLTVDTYAVKYARALVLGFSYDYENGEDEITESSLRAYGTKAKITFDVIQGGKKTSLSCNVTLKKHPNIFSKVMLGKKNFASDINKYHYSTIEFPEETVKVSVKTKSGYKIENIRIDYANGTTKTIKNNTKVSLKDVNGMTIYYKATKKPANYKAPRNWYGKTKGPLYCYRSVENVNAVYEYDDDCYDEEE